MRYVLVTSIFLFSCQKPPEAADDAYTIRETKIVREPCDTAHASEKLDADGDGTPEIYVVTNGGRKTCRWVDLDFDGRADRTTFFGSSGQVRRIESDFDRDGRVDEIAIYRGGVIREKHRATTLDGKLDTWEFYESGQLARSERDENGDGVIDQWWEYGTPDCPLIYVDVDADGRPDSAATIDYCKDTGAGYLLEDPNNSPNPEASTQPPPEPAGKKQ